MGAKIPQLEMCCCGCSLRTGTLIILWFYGIYGLMLMLSPTLKSGYVNPSQVNVTITANEYSKSYSEFLDYITFQPVVTVVLGLTDVIVCGFGLYGVYKEIAVYLLPFIIFGILYQIIFSLNLLIGLFTFHVIVTLIFQNAIMFYFLLVVFSHYRVLKGSARPTQA